VLRPNAERQTGPARDITNKEVGFIAGNVPGLRGETAGAGLLKPVGRSMLVAMWRSSTGVAVLIPTLPELSTLSELAGAPASTSKTIVPVSSPLSVVPRSTNARKLAPPLAELFALIVQSLVGKPARCWCR